MNRLRNFFKSKLWQELWLYFFIGVKLTNYSMKLPEPKVNCLKDQKVNCLEEQKSNILIARTTLYIGLHTILFVNYLFCEPLLKLRHLCLADNYFIRKPGFEVNRKSAVKP